MNMKRMRGRGGHRQGGGGGQGGGQGGGGGGYRQTGQQPVNRNHVFDSSGPDMRMRGTAQQLFEKYLQLGRDATGSGDRVMAESYFQHAEHYFRIINAMAQTQNQGGGQNNGQPQQAQQRRWQNGPESLEQAQEGEADDESEEPGSNGRAGMGAEADDAPAEDGRSPAP